MELQYAENLLNFRSSEYDKQIYRVIPTHRLLEIFERKELVLVEPQKWDDPFENLLLKGHVKGAFDNYPETAVFRNSIYGQCWTSHRETDAMWRIYSSDKQGVKIRCKISTLLNDIVRKLDQRDAERFFIGKVEYVYQKEILERLQNINGIYGIEAARSLLFKRKEFSHESEVRLISTQGAGDEIRRFSFDPFSTIDEIVFDPRMNDYTYNAYRDALKNKGFKGRVAKSVMYQLPAEFRNCS
jgi:hypothetical protein